MLWQDRLSGPGPLRADDVRLLENLLGHRARMVPPRRDLIVEGERPRYVTVILSGFAQRYKQLSDGRRQVLSFFIPGDICDANMFLLKRMDHSISTITHVTLAEISKHDFDALVESSPAIARALWWNELVTLAIQREWTTNIGQRSAYERIAHLLCELFTRLQAAGLTEGESCAFPFTQSEIAEATGLTQVHVNRMVQDLRRDGFIELREKRLRVLDFEGLKTAALFDPSYLHLDQADPMMEPRKA